jgi:hypothetical protein
MNHTQRARRRSAGWLLLAVSLGACDFISPLDTNPNAVPVASVDQLFTGIQVNTFFFSEGQLSRIASIWTQQMAGTDRQFAIIDTYRLNEEDADGEFSAVYTGGGLVDIRQAIAQAEDADRRVYAGILKVHEAYLVGMAASAFGAIPYSEAVNADIENPALDTQASVYTAVQALLDEAIADLRSGAGTGPGAVDLNFGGSAAAWEAVAHTLKARFHMHWAEVDGNSRYAAALAAAGDGISSAAGAWRTVHSTASTENNLWYQFMRDRSGYISAGDYLVPLMVAHADPRLPFYFGAASGGGYVARDSELSDTGYGAPGFGFPIVSCAENYFIVAEAQYRLGDEPAAIAAVEDALACQEDQWGVDLSARAAVIGALTGDALFDAIMDQKYIAMFLNMEVWNDYKRTCRPAITERAGGMPARLFYGQQERQANANIPVPAQQPSRNANDPNGC